MKLSVIGSGSSGNTYVLHNGVESLVIDCGMPFKDVMRVLDYNVTSIRGCIVTHKHLDHLKYASEYEKSGIPVNKAYENNEDFTKVKYGGFTIKSFRVPHDNEPCCGYLIEHKDIGRLLYLTDLSYCKYNFKKLKLEHLLIEANYDLQFVDKSIPNFEHVLRGHMALPKTIEFIKDNKTNNLIDVAICHLSRENADSEYFLDEVKKVSDCDTYVATRGLEIELKDSNCPFM